LGKVDRIGLSSNNLKGSLIKELGQLIHLKMLYLSDNPLSGSIPAEIKSLKLLDGNLDLNRTQIKK